ncbi:MAG TPA: response regulator, partial [Beijerinckiaceae bacterium]
MSTQDILRAERGVILAVDDEPDILIALEDLLEDQYEVLTASSPSRGLEILRARPDVLVIVSDERMPGMMGHAFLRAAREMSEAQAILLTGYADLPAVVAALNEGRISGYMRKPWDADALRAMVMNAAQRRRLELELALERALLRGLLTHLPDAISFKDAQGRFLRLNAAKASRIGCALDDCVGRIESDLLTDEAAAAALRAADQAAVAKGESV